MPTKSQPNRRAEKRAKALLEIEALAQQRTEKAIKRLSFWCDQKEDGMAAVNAALVLIEIGWGRSTHYTDRSDELTNRLAFQSVLAGFSKKEAAK